VLYLYGANVEAYLDALRSQYEGIPVEAVGETLEDLQVEVVGASELVSRARPPAGTIITRNSAALVMRRNGLLPARPGERVTRSELAVVTGAFGPLPAGRVVYWRESDLGGLLWPEATTMMDIATGRTTTAWRSAPPPPPPVYRPPTAELGALNSASTGIEIAQQAAGVAEVLGFLAMSTNPALGAGVAIAGALVEAALSFISQAEGRNALPPVDTDAVATFTKAIANALENQQLQNDADAAQAIVDAVGAAQAWLNNSNDPSGDDSQEAQAQRDAILTYTAYAMPGGQLDYAIGQIMAFCRAPLDALSPSVVDNDAIDVTAITWTQDLAANFWAFPTWIVCSTLQLLALESRVALLEVASGCGASSNDVLNAMYQGSDTDTAPTDDVVGALQKAYDDRIREAANMCAAMSSYSQWRQSQVGSVTGPTLVHADTTYATYAYTVSDPNASPAQVVDQQYTCVICLGPDSCSSCQSSASSAASTARTTYVDGIPGTLQTLYGLADDWSLVGNTLDSWKSGRQVAYDLLVDGPPNPPGVPPTPDPQHWAQKVPFRGSTNWVPGYSVQYAMSWLTAEGETDIGLWSDPPITGPWALPCLEIETSLNPLAIGRKIYRHFTGSTVECIGEVDDNTTTRFQDEMP
jgi:hypothetical protein